jgi:acyl dehydratase
MVAEQKWDLEDLRKELHENYRKIFTSQEMVQFWGGDKYPGPFVFFNREATRDTMVHFVDGIGDVNLLYRDEEYGKTTKYGKLTAHPSFVFTVCSLAQAPSVRSTAIGWDIGYEVEWFRPILQGESFDWRVMYPSNVEERESAMAGKSLIISTECEFTDQDKEPVAISREWCVSVETDKAVALKKYADIKLYEYSDKELEAIYLAQDNEPVRGGELRYWEDVQVGEEVTPIVRGPLTMMEVAAWLVGCGSPISKTDNLWRRIDMYNRKVADPVTKALINLELVHMDDRVGKMVGVPAAYDFGVQRVAWLSSLMTNWMGDDGFLWKLRGELRRFNITGDTQWFKGKVARKYIEDGKCCVDIECRGENQRGELTTSGKSTVILPSREHGPVVYPAGRRIA